MNVDRYIISIKRSFLLMFALLIATLYSAARQYELYTTAKLAVLLEVSQATIELSSSLSSLPDLTTKSLGVINPFEGAHQVAESMKYLDTVSRDVIRKLPLPPTPADLQDQTIRGIKFARMIPYQLQQTNCSAAVYRGPSNSTIFFAPNPLFDEYNKVSPFVSGDRVYLVDFGWRCVPFRLALQIFF